ncbi:MAG: PAS domain-containing sensor histidine kinase [Pyrinomonadaceae bacterium]
MSERRFNQLMEKVTNFAIIFKDTNGIIEEWNVGAENIFGWTREEAIGKSIQMIYTPTDRANGESQREMQTAAAEGKAEDERWHTRHDGSLFYASGLLHAIYEEGVLTGFVKIVRDLTQRVSLEAALHDAKNQMAAKLEEKTDEFNKTFKVLTLEAARRERDSILHSALVRRVMMTQEDERKRIARDLHDQFGQKLTALRLRMAGLKAEIGEDSELRDRLERLEILANDLDSDVSFLAWELRPATIDELGLETTLDNFIDEWSQQFEIAAEFNLARSAKKRLASVLEINLYRIAQEALNNIAKYAKASNVNVTLTDVDHSVALTVKDDGVGFDPDEERGEERGLGLVGMGERAAILQGRLEIESAKGKGTTVRVQVPALYDEADSATV